MTRDGSQVVTKSKRRSAWTWLGRVLVASLLLITASMLWGGHLLELADPLPAHADVAIVLEGSLTGERVRLAGAMDLLRRGVAQRALITLPPISYWGEPVPPAARRFLERQFGSDLAQRVDFCDAGPDVDSTRQEAEAINLCIREHGWTSVVVVTSNYHTRRAGIIWRKVMQKANPALQISVYGVTDPEFQADGWWRKRLWAKTWLMESTKLVWTELGGK